MKRFRMVLVMLLLPVLLGQTVPASESGGMEAELARLKAENAQLREELSKAKAQLGEKPAATAPKARVFTTMLDVLGNTPADIRPQAKPEWYKYTESKFTSWWTEQLVGMDFEQKMAVGKPIVWRNLAPRPGGEWIVNPIGFSYQPFTYFGAEHKWAVAVPTMLYVDEAGAKKWDGIKDGTLITVKGKIGGVRIQSDNYDKSKLPVYRVSLDLREVEYGLPK